MKINLGSQADCLTDIMAKVNHDLEGYGLRFFARTGDKFGISDEWELRTITGKTLDPVDTSTPYPSGQKNFPCICPPPRARAVFLTTQEGYELPNSEVAEGTLRQRVTQRLKEQGIEDVAVIILEGVNVTVVE